MQLLSVNTNGIKHNDNQFITRTICNYHLTCLQETKFRDCHHLATFRHHLNANFQNQCFVSDLNGSLPSCMHSWSAGVATILHFDFPGFSTVVAMHKLTIQGRYLVVRIQFQDRSLYIHNIYAPVVTSERVVFFDSIPTGIFGHDAIHFVLGDLNTQIGPSLDCSQPRSRAHDPSRSRLLQWTAALNVIEGWRLHNPSTQVFTGPPPRKIGWTTYSSQMNLFSTITELPNIPRYNTLEIT